MDNEIPDNMTLTLELPDGSTRTLPLTDIQAKAVAQILGLSFVKGELAGYDDWTIQQSLTE